MEINIEGIFKLALYKKMEELKEVFDDYLNNPDMDFQLLRCENDINRILSLFINEYSRYNREKDLELEE